MSCEVAPEKKAATSTPRLKHIDVDNDGNLLRFYRFRRVHSHIVGPLWCVCFLWVLCSQIFQHQRGTTNANMYPS
jgi:hypothetical protein